MKKILIVEDDKDFLWILRHAFEKESFALSFAENGEEGLALAQSIHPDMMIVDIMMPKLNGIEMVRALKSQQALPVLIFLTNLKDDHHVAEVMDVTDGVADYIVKADISIDALLSRVRHKLEIE